MTVDAAVRVLRAIITHLPVHLFIHVFNNLLWAAPVLGVGGAVMNEAEADTALLILAGKTKAITWVICLLYFL